jgi:hypothetical protein
MQSRLGVRLVKNQQDALYLGLVLLRQGNIPIEIRCYMQRFLRVPVCKLDKYFNQLLPDNDDYDPWRKENMQMYHSMLVHHRSDVYMNPQHYSPNVLMAMVFSLSLRGMKVNVIIDDDDEFPYIHRMKNMIDDYRNDYGYTASKYDIYGTLYGMFEDNKKGHVLFIRERDIDYTYPRFLSIDSADIIVMVFVSISFYFNDQDICELSIKCNPD